MTILYGIIFIVTLPFAACYALFCAIRDRLIPEPEERYEVTEAGKLLTRKATPEELREPKIYRMVERSPSEATHANKSPFQ